MLTHHPMLISVNINRLTILDTVECLTLDTKIEKSETALIHMSRKTSKYPTTKHPLTYS